MQYSRSITGSVTKSNLSDIEVNGGGYFQRGGAQCRVLGCLDGGGGKYTDLSDLHDFSLIDVIDVDNGNLVVPYKRVYHLSKLDILYMFCAKFFTCQTLLEHLHRRRQPQPGGPLQAS